jgi:Flp pilus assembly protein TadD
MTTGPTGGSAPARSALALVAAVAGLVAAVLACYLPTPGDYWISYDNPQMIQQEPRIQALALTGGARVEALETLVSTPHHDLYQPLASLSWAIDYALFGWDRSGFHAHSLALHVLVVLALFFLALRLSGSILAAFLAALLCGVHPVMVQSVCWTISRTSSLAAAWILIGCHLHLCYVKRPGHYVLLALSLLAFVLSMTAKPVPGVFLLPILLNLWVRRPLRLAVWLEALPLALAALGLTLVNLQISHAFAGEASIVRPWLDVLRKAPESLALTVANILWPRDLALYYSYELGGSLVGWRWLTVAGATLGVAAGGYALWRRGERGLLLSVAAFLSLLTPQMASIRYRDILTADRYVYIPMLFLAVGAACLLASGLAAQRNHNGPPEPRLSGFARFGAVGLALLAALALGTQSRSESRRWADEEALWQRVVQQTPAPLPYLALCNLYAGEDRPADAVAACIRAHELALNDPYAAKDVRYVFDLAAQARIAGEKSQASDGEAASQRTAHYFDLAAATAERGISRWPERVDLRYELARSQLSAGDARAAVETFEALLVIEPNDQPSISYLAVALFELGEFDRALELLEADPNAGWVEPIRYRTLARIYTERGQHELAAGANLAWLEAQPDDPAAHAAFRASMRAAEQEATREKSPMDRLDQLRGYYRQRYGG